MSRGFLKETPHVKQPRYRCQCGELVEQDDIIAGRHLAYVCPKAPDELKRAALAIPGVAVVQPTAADVERERQRDREKRLAGRIRQRARQRGRG